MKVGQLCPTHLKMAYNTTEEVHSNCLGIIIMEHSLKSLLRAHTIAICTFSKILTKCILTLLLYSLLLFGSTWRHKLLNLVNMMLLLDSLFQQLLILLLALIQQVSAQLPTLSMVELNADNTGKATTAGIESSISRNSSSSLNCQKKKKALWNVVTKQRDSQKEDMVTQSAISIIL